MFLSNWLVPILGVFHFSFFQSTEHHTSILIVVISVRFTFNSCSTFIGQVSLPCIRQLLIQVAYTLPFSYNENPFPVVWVNIPNTFIPWRSDWPLLLNHILILHLHPTCLLQDRIYLPFPVISQYQYPDAMSVKPMCDWPIYLTASADEWLACLKQIPFHSTTLLTDPLIVTMAQNQIIANSLLTYRNAGPLAFLLHRILRTTMKHYLYFSCIHLQTFGFQPWFPLYNVI